MAATSHPFDRYQTLRLREFLSTSSHYVFACKELSFILKSAYAKLPKDLQSLIFQDTLFSFSLLPEMQSQSAISAANSLLKSAEFAFPKQKRTLAVKEYKHAVVSSKRRSKANHEEPGLCPLPYDVLVHVFRLLDVQSLVSASAVCRSWNSAADDRHLWIFLYTKFFCDSTTMIKLKKGKIHNIDTWSGIDARCKFKLTYKGSRLKFNRAYCSSCRSIVWLSSYKCSNKVKTKDRSAHQVKPISTQQIVDYIVDDIIESETESSSDSDSDTEDWAGSKFWGVLRR